MAAEEADVDIEGDVVPAAAQPGSDENTASVLQDHYLDSSWRTENGLIPWTLDSTISEENRAVIEKMLLEEEYPLMIMRKVKISG
ncbi:histone H2A deubiquitinase MYSM1-like [Leptonychotes weddellii]|uniref:Histone H2A deubiquitinase MYSM1-like n=1 Tax=Leptonychotes weddellii TaxID=9713 RepID=A0A7F8RAK3_LEPWE|nr:histone H2A deubiquitinase MYSM1-like [Leptonychotes weddellii]